MFVRSSEDENNHYLQILKNSGLWAVYSGNESYKKIKHFTDFNLSEWSNKNINWKKDFEKEMFKYLKDNDLIKYLKW